MSSPNDDRDQTGTSGSELLTKGGVTESEDSVPEDLFDPGPSFARGDRPKIRLSEMPAWLQTFAASLGSIDLTNDAFERDFDDASESPETSADMPSEQPGDGDELDPAPALPAWLSRPRSGANTAVLTSDLADDAVISSLISEDDLPEWLRAVGPTGSTAVAGVQAASDVGSSKKTLSVPPVARAWVNHFNTAQLSDGGSTFAVVASQAQALVVQPSGDDGTRQVESLSEVAGATEEADPKANLRQQEPAALTMVDSERPEASSPGRRRLYSVAALIIMLIVLVVLVLQIAL